MNDSNRPSTDLARNGTATIDTESQVRDNSNPARQLWPLAGLEKLGVSQARHADAPGDRVQSRPATAESQGVAGHRKGTAAQWLLGRRVRSPLATHQFEREWSADDPAFVAEHRVFGHVLVPGAAYAALALLTGLEPDQSATGGHIPITQRRRRSRSTRSVTLDGLEFREIMPLTEDGARRLLHTVVKSAATQRGCVQIVSTPADRDAWTVHAGGFLVGASSSQEDCSAENWPGVAQLRARCPKRFDGPALHGALRHAGYDLGPTFQWLDTAYRGTGEAFAELRSHLAREASAGQVLTGLLDSCFQLLQLAHFEFGALEGDAIYVPLCAERLEVASNYEDAFYGHSTAYECDDQDEIVSGDVTLRDSCGHVVVEARGVTLRRVTRVAFEKELFSLADWMHEVIWSATEQPTPSRAPVNGQRWLVFADDSGVGEHAVRELGRRGHDCTVITRSQFAARASEREWLDGDGERVYQGVLYLWPLDAQDEPQPGEKHADAVNQLHNASAGLLELLKGMAWAASPGRVWIGTRGAQSPGRPARASAAKVPVTESETSPIQAALWGLGRVVANEHPELWGGLIDLDPASEAPRAAQQLVASLLDSTTEQEVAWRDGDCLVPRVVAAEGSYDSTEPLALRSDGTYLIVGDHRGVERHIVDLFVDRGAGTVIVIGRDTEAIADLARERGRVMGFQADISDSWALATILEQVRHNAPPLRGVVYAVDRPDEGTLLRQDMNRIVGTFAGKALGAWHLHWLTESEELDFFVFFSSKAALLGAPGQMAPATADAFIDGLVHFRRQCGLPATSVSWGPWADWPDLGEVVQTNAAKEIEHSHGVSVLIPERAMHALEAVIERNPVHVAVARADWLVHAEATGINSPMLAHLIPLRAVLEPKSDPSDLRADLTGSPPELHVAILRRYIADLAAMLLGASADEKILDHSLCELGMDSLTIIEFKNRLQRALGCCSLSLASLSGHPTVDSLSTYLAETCLNDNGERQGEGCARQGCLEGTEGPSTRPGPSGQPADRSRKSGRPLRTIALAIL
ncbi:MAG: type I polyketide synthase [Proteobacteria bacterium]|nr:type I polyketide synthase [Pseudomonadota bacterium]